MSFLLSFRLICISCIPLIVVASEVKQAAMDLPPNIVYKVSNVNQCYSLCFASGGCSSFNYEVQKRECELFFSNDSGNLMSKSNSVYVNLSNENGDYGPCTFNSCENNEMCVTVHNNIKCFPIICAAGAVWSTLNNRCVEGIICSPTGHSYHQGYKCGQFIQCVDGKAYVHDCSPGTVWDETIQSCVSGTC